MLGQVAWAVIPFSESMVSADTNASSLYGFSVSALGVYGIAAEAVAKPRVAVGVCKRIGVGCALRD